MKAEFSVAVHGLVYLWHKNEIISSEQLANNICTNPARVRKVMSKLRQAELVMSKEGKGSGYHCIPEGDKINLCQILDALDERIVDSTWKSGDTDMDCLIASGMAAILDGIYVELNSDCRRKLEEKTIGDINEIIFGKN